MTYNLYKCENDGIGLGARIAGPLDIEQAFRTAKACGAYGRGVTPAGGNSFLMWSKDSEAVFTFAPA